MPELDARTIGQEMVRVGLIPEEKFRQGLDEIGGPQVEGVRLLLYLERKGIITPWQSSKFLKGDREGFILGGYRLLYKIQSGSFGRVFRGEDQSSGRVVAIKVLRRRWSDDQQRIELFQREARVGMSMHHPNIVEILAMNRDKNSAQYYIVMEFVEGWNAREMLAIRKKLEPLEAIRITEDCANGLAYAYSLGVTHRDMKLTNILDLQLQHGQAGGLRAGQDLLGHGGIGRGEGRADRRLCRPGEGHQHPARRHPQRHLFPGMRRLRTPDRLSAAGHDPR